MSMDCGALRMSGRRIIETVVLRSPVEFSSNHLHEMKTIEQLVSEFDDLHLPAVAFAVEPPTDSSIRKINTHFAIELPHELILFAKLSKSFGSWFASLGEDYDSPKHIIRINSYWRRRRKTRAIPRNLLIINRGFDDDLDCIELDSLNVSTGACSIRYWFPGCAPEDSTVYPTFVEYVQTNVGFWKKSRK